MDPSLRSNGSNPRPATQASARSGGKSRVAGRIDRVLNTALAGERAAVLNASSAELLAEPFAVAAVLGSALDRPGVGLLGHFMTHELLRRSQLYDDLINALASPDAGTRAAAARICGAARMSEAIVWIADLLQDPSPEVGEAAVRSLSRLGGRRAVEHLMAAGDRIPLYRLAIALSRAASDVDIEALMRQPAMKLSERFDRRYQQTPATGPQAPVTGPQRPVTAPETPVDGAPSIAPVERRAVPRAGTSAQAVVEALRTDGPAVLSPALAAA